MGDPAKHGDALALLRKQIEAAKELGARGILTVPGGTWEDITHGSAKWVK